MSTDVIVYEGEVTVAGQVTDFVDIIDPQNWHDNHPFIWPQSYLIDLAGGPLPPDRDADPPALAKVATNPRGGFLFEQVFFGGAIIYSNVINTRLAFSASRLQLDYSEVDCRTTWSPLRTADGGIDIDTGVAVIVPAAAAGFVRVTVTKTVRFTEPTPLVNTARPFFGALVKFTMDALLQSLKF
jgi:hypothetical protein